MIKIKKTKKEQLKSSCAHIFNTKGSSRILSGQHPCKNKLADMVKSDVRTFHFQTQCN